MYVRFVKDGKICQQQLFETNTKGESIFNRQKKFYDEKEILLTNIISAARDGASALTRRYKCFIAYLKNDYLFNLALLMMKNPTTCWFTQKCNEYQKVFVWLDFTNCFTL